MCCAEIRKYLRIIPGIPSYLEICLLLISHPTLQHFTVGASSEMFCYSKIVKHMNSKIILSQKQAQLMVVIKLTFNGT